MKSAHKEMNRIKPPYKFKSPYWAHDPAGKQNDKYRFGLLSFGPNGGFKEVNNSESNYYKNCTLCLPNYMDKVLDLYKEEYKKLKERIIYEN